jgi:hypothetical protein
MDVYSLGQVEAEGEVGVADGVSDQVLIKGVIRAEPAEPLTEEVLGRFIVRIVEPVVRALADQAGDVRSLLLLKPGFADLTFESVAVPLAMKTPQVEAGGCNISVNEEVLRWLNATGPQALILGLGRGGDPRHMQIKEGTKARINLGPPQVEK